MRLKQDDVILRTAVPSDKVALYDLMTGDEEWVKFNGPYFGYQRPTRERFEEVMYAGLKKGGSRMLIDYGGDAIGMVSYHWKDERTRWLKSAL